MLGRSHVTLAGATYLSLLVHPLPTPWGALAAPLLRPAAGDGPLGPDELALALSVATVTLAALAQDIDHGVSATARPMGLLSRAVASVVARVVHHRGPLHSELAILLAGVLAELLGARLGMSGLGLLAGYGWLAHVLADAITNRGVPLLWPLWRRRVRSPTGWGRRRAGAYARGFGLRDAEAGRPATPDTAFGIASVAKPFTALAVLLLEEAGILAVGDSVRRWLPEFRLPGGSPQAAADAEAVTLHHLLTHTKCFQRACCQTLAGPAEV